MTKKFLCASIVIAAAGSSILAQSPEPTPTPVRLVVTNTMPAIKPASTPAPRIVEKPVVIGDAQKEAGPSARSEAPIIVGSAPAATPKTTSVPSNSSARIMSFGQMKNKIAEAKRFMQSRPIATAATTVPEGQELVRVALHDWKTNELDYVVMTKESFLSTKGDKQLMSQNGRRFTARTIRGNGVNTPVVLIDENGDSQLPLLVQYPVIRGGQYVETAYYMSTHPGLVTPEVVNAGRYYVRNVLEIARGKLKDHNITIQPKIVDIAERLAAVEHVDHQRFRNEYHPTIYNDIYTLFALNEGQTYRYSVSSAGAGGMVQMIPSTYRMVRSWHTNVPLMPDFVEGMRNHTNASQAMLLYMQRTWNDLVANATIRDALDSGIATPEQLVAAGYNSNPARLAGYIKRGGANWTNLIPRETQVYLRIYESIEKHVPMAERAR